jgi:hypothetical protein
MHLAAMDGNLTWRLDPESHLVSPNLDNSNHDVLVDYDALILFSGQDQHGRMLSEVAGCRLARRPGNELAASRDLILRWVKNGGNAVGSCNCMVEIATRAF